LYPSSSHIALGLEFASSAVTKEYEEKVIEDVRAPHVEAMMEIEKPSTAEVTYMVNSKDSTAEVDLGDDAEVIEIDDNGVDDIPLTRIMSPPLLRILWSLEIWCLMPRPTPKAMEISRVTASLSMLVDTLERSTRS
jgi:hypothetical protein